MHEVVDRNCSLWTSSSDSVFLVTLHIVLSHYVLSSYTHHAPSTPATFSTSHAYCFTDDALNLPAVLAGAVVAFLLLTLLIAGIIVGAVLLRRGKCKEKALKKAHWVKEVECTKKSTELTGRGRESAAGHSEQWADEAAFHYEQHVADMHYESTDFDGEGCCGREDGNAIRLERNQSDGVGAAENTATQCALGHTTMSNDQHIERPRGNPNAVYAVVDKRKIKKQEKTQGGASATTTQGADTEEQHYEWSSGFGQDWIGDVNLEVNHDDIGQRIPSNDVWVTGPQCEPYNPDAVYAVDSEEQHYECSTILGQDWLGNAVGEKLKGREVEQGSPCNDVKETESQSEPYIPCA